MKLIITPPVKELGIDARLVSVRGATISNKSNILERRKKEAVGGLHSLAIATHPVLQGYHQLYQRLHLPDYTPPAEHLIGLAQRNGRLPNINTVVDCYNLVSAQTGLSVGAHDLAFIEGDLTFQLTDGSELYVPLGESAPSPVAAGEYACMDAVKIICRLDVKQCDQTKITKTTQALVIYVQGNANTTAEYLENGLLQLCDLLREICGGVYEVLAST